MKTRKVHVGDGAPWVYAMHLVAGDKLANGQVVQYIHREMLTGPYAVIVVYAPNQREYWSDTKVCLWDKPVKEQP